MAKTETQDDSSIQPITISVLPSGPGFKTPSMNPECLALIGYFHLLSSATTSPLPLTTEWCWDASVSPNGRLPIIRCSCGLQKAGVLSIFGHLQSCSVLGRKGSLESWMDESQQSDCYAWSSYFSSSVAMIVDLYLYVTPENYYSTTQPAYTNFLPWYANYLIPPSHRKAAERRTEHLGVHELLGVSKDEEPDSAAVKTRSGGVDPTTGFPARFGLGKANSSLLKAQQSIRLESLISKIFSPLSQLLGQRKYFLSNDRPCSLDAIALGYFKILLDTEVPDPWVAKQLKEKYPNLVHWCSENGRYVK